MISTWHYLLQNSAIFREEFIVGELKIRFVNHDNWFFKVIKDLLEFLLLVIIFSKLNNQVVLGHCIKPIKTVNDNNAKKNLAYRLCTILYCWEICKSISKVQSSWYKNYEKSYKKVFHFWGLCAVHHFLDKRENHHNWEKK